MIEMLYKYFPLRNAQDLLRVENVIENNEVHFSRLNDFNDPFDCYPIYISPKENFPDWIERLKAKHPVEKLNQVEKIWLAGGTVVEQFSKNTGEGLIKAINEELGICCFSTQPDNLLMWAHYASFHSGICFGFEATSNTLFFGEALPVCYKPRRPIINIFNPDFLQLAEAAFLTKSSHWEYESEYRIIVPTRKPGLHKFPKELLKVVILGARIDPEHKKSINEILQKQQVLIRQAVLDDAIYKINILSGETAQ